METMAFLLNLLKAMSICLCLWLIGALAGILFKFSTFIKLVKQNASEILSRMIVKSWILTIIGFFLGIINLMVLNLFRIRFLQVAPVRDVVFGSLDSFVLLGVIWLTIAIGINLSVLCDSYK